MNSFSQIVKDGSTKLGVALLSTTIVRTDLSEHKIAADRVVVAATNAPKAASGMPRFRRGDSRGAGPSWSVEVAEDAGLPADSAAADAEVAVDAVTSTKEVSTALGENPNICCSG